MKILILCTGNSCRSQMAEAFMQKALPQAEIYSAGTGPAPEIHPFTVKVMHEAGFDLSGKKPKNVDQFLRQTFDYVVTVCDEAKESCPVFIGNVKQRLHFGFEDPAKAAGTDEEVLRKFREVRDLIRQRFETWAKNIG